MHCLPNPRTRFKVPLSGVAEGPACFLSCPGRWGVQVPIGFHDDHGGDDDLEEFHDDAHHRHGDLGILLLTEHRAQGHADKGAAAVPHHHGDGQGHHRQGKHHRVGGVAVGPQIVGVGNEDLVHDVVQCPHQQGDHAGNGA